MNVNQPAYFEKQARVEQRQNRLRVRVPVKPGGIWQPGTEMKFSFKLSRPCERWKVDPDGEAFGGTMGSVQIGPEENTDVIFFATTTAPRPGKDIVFDIECPQPVEVTQGAWSPTGP